MQPSSKKVPLGNKKKNRFDKLLHLMRFPRQVGGKNAPQKGVGKNPKWAAAVLETFREPLKWALKNEEGKERGKPLRLGSLISRLRSPHFPWGYAHIATQPDGATHVPPPKKPSTPSSTFWPVCMLGNFFFLFCLLLLLPFALTQKCVSRNILCRQLFSEGVWGIWRGWQIGEVGGVGDGSTPSTPGSQQWSLLWFQ